MDILKFCDPHATQERLHELGVPREEALLPNVRLCKYRGTTTGKGAPGKDGYRISIDGKLLVVKWTECERRMGGSREHKDYAPATKGSIKIGWEECAYESGPGKWQVFMRYGEVVGGEGNGIYHLDTIKV